MEMRCYRKILRTSYKDHVTNEEVHAKIQQAIGPQEDLLMIVKRRKLQWYGHVSRSSGIVKTILQVTVNGGKKIRQTEEEVGRQHQGMDRPGVRQVPEGSGEQGEMEKTDCKIICGAPTTLAVKGLMLMMMMCAALIPYFHMYLYFRHGFGLCCQTYNYKNVGSNTRHCGICTLTSRISVLS